MSRSSLVGTWCAPLVLQPGRYSQDLISHVDVFLIFPMNMSFFSFLHLKDSKSHTDKCLFEWLIFKKISYVWLFHFHHLTFCWVFMFSLCCAVLCCANSLQLCLTLHDPVDDSPPGSSVHGILQARSLEWVAMPSFRGSSWPRDLNCVSKVSCIGRQALYH